MWFRRVLTTRAGGVSIGPYDSFNLGCRSGDDSAVCDTDAIVTTEQRLAPVALTADRVPASYRRDGTTGRLAAVIWMDPA
jgi:copper oxidase (laccase) domain-containing protein